MAPNSHVEKLVFYGEPWSLSGVTGGGNNLDNLILRSGYGDNLFGGGGDDEIHVGGWDNIHGDAGDDLIYAGDDAVNSIDHLWGDAGNDTLWGGLGNDEIRGGAGNDVIYGGRSNDDLEDGPDTIYGDAGDDTVWAGGCDDVVRGGAGNDSLYGQSDDDKLYGGDGADMLGGGSGNDLLDGGLGDDKLTGREGLDRLYGGGGIDRFDYDYVTYSSPGTANRDVIYDFTGAGTAAGDLIDLSTVDADSGASGNQTFDFIENAAFSSAGQVRVQGSGADSLVQANVTGTSGAEMEILVKGVAYGQWDASDFVL